MRTGPWRVRWCCRTPGDRSGHHWPARTDSGALLVAGARGTDAILRALAPAARPDRRCRLRGRRGRGTHPAAPEFGGGASELVLSGDGRAYLVGRANGGIRAVCLDRDRGSLPSAAPAPSTSSAPSRASRVTRAPGVAVDASGDLVVAGLVLPRLDGVLGIARRLARARRRVPSDFNGSSSSPTFATGVATLRAASTNVEDVDFGRATTAEGSASDRRNDPRDGPARQLRAAHRHGRPRLQRPGPDRGYNLVGFVIEDGSAGDDSFDSGQAIHVLPSGAVWTSEPRGEAGGATLVAATVWVDRDPSRAFPPLGN